MSDVDAVFVGQGPVTRCMGELVDMIRKGTIVQAVMTDLPCTHAKAMKVVLALELSLVGGEHPTPTPEPPVPTPVPTPAPDGKRFKPDGILFGGSSEEEANLAIGELAVALGVQSPEGFNGIITTVIVQAVLAELLARVKELIDKWIEDARKL